MTVYCTPHKIWPTVLLCLLAMASSSCSLAPDYQKPDLAVPVHWQTAASQPWQPAQPADQQARGHWWQHFNDGELNALQQQLYQPQNAEVIERSVFLNKLLLRKGISWTRIFADLEKVLPYKVRIIQVRPAITTTNDVYLEMDVASQTSEPVIDMLMRMEGSEQFGATHVATWLPPSQTEPMYRYRINVNYGQKF